VKEITYQELLTLSQTFIGRKVELALSSPVFSVNTYQYFNLHSSDDVLAFYDRGETRQELRIDKDKISKILYVEGESIYNRTFSVFLNNQISIDFCLDESPILCVCCKKEVVDFKDKCWKIHGVGSYGSRLEGENLVDGIPICDDCLFFKVLGYAEGDIYDGELH